MLLAGIQEKTWVRIITVVSIVIPLVVALLVYLPAGEIPGFTGVRYLPLFHASLNGMTFILLLSGFYFIMNKQIAKHRASMLGAFALSSIFLLSYVAYHYSTPSTPFGGEGFIRYIYFPILIAHIVLAVVIVPLALFTLYRGLSVQYAAHKKIARWTLPVWLFVALSGVVVYIMMRPYYPV
jgi:putative membrane protein